MEKLELNSEQKKLFLNALQEAYDAGQQNATFLANSMYQLVTPPKEVIEKLTTKYIN